MTVNKRAYNGGQDTIEELVHVLSKPGVKGWPAPLSIPVVYNEETAKILPDGSGNVNGHSAAADPTMPWLHPRIKKGDAEGTLHVIHNICVYTYDYMRAVRVCV